MKNTRQVQGIGRLPHSKCCLKTIRIFLLSLLFPAALCAQEHGTDWQKMGLKGNVRSVTEIKYKATLESGKIQKLYKGSWIKYQFNASGFLTEKTDLDPHDGTLIEKRIYIYDSRGMLTLINHYRSDDVLSSVSSIVYDSLGYLVEERITHIQTEDQGHDTRYVYTNDQQGNCIGMTGYNSTGDCFTRYTYAYDSKGNRMEEVWQDGNGALIHTYAYRYNNRGNKTEETYTYTSGGGGKTKTTYVYDERGNLVQEKWGGAEGNVIDISNYTLDKHFNWITETTVENKQPISVTERELEYFE